MLRFSDVRPLGGHEVEATLTDGSVRRIDLGPWLGGAAFDEVRQSAEAFARIHVDPVSRTVAWPGGLDLDPEVLLDPAWVASVSAPSA